MKHFILFSLVLSIFGLTYGQQNAIVWAKQFGNNYPSSGKLVRYNNSEGIILSGLYNTMVSYDSLGTTKYLYGTQHNLFWIMYDTTGTFRRIHQISAPNDLDIQDMEIDTSRHLYMAGYFRDSIYSGTNTLLTNTRHLHDSELFLIKTGTDGNILWAKKCDGPASEDKINLAVTPDNNLILSGNFSDSLNILPSVNNRVIHGKTNDAFIAKLSTEGIISWIDILSSSTWLNIESVTTDPYNNILLTGNQTDTIIYIHTTDNTSDTLVPGSGIFFMKIDSSGHRLWTKTITPTQGIVSNPKIKTDSIGNIYLAGNYSGSADMDPGTETHSLPNAYSSMFVAKYTQNGDYIWSFGIIPCDTCSGSRANRPWPMMIGGLNDIITRHGDIYITGLFYHFMDFDGSDTGTFYMHSAGDADIFLARYDNDGNFVWAKSYGSDYTDSGNSLVSGGNSDLYLTGRFEDSIHFENHYLHGNGTLAYLLRYDLDSSLPINQVFTKEDFRIGPNPVQNDLFIENTQGKTFTWQIADTYGRIIKASKRPIISDHLRLHFPPGIYYLIIRCQGKTGTFPLIKE